VAIEIIKKLKKERKAKLLELFSRLNHINLMENQERVVAINQLNIDKSQIEKYYFTTITNMLLTNRDLLIRKLQNPRIPDHEKVGIQKELQENDQLAREFEAEILQEKLLLKNQLKLPNEEIIKIQNRLHQLGYTLNKSSHNEESL